MNNPWIFSNLVFQESDYEYIDDVSNDIDSGGFSEGAEGDSDYTGDESDYGTSNDYEEVEYDYQLAEDPVPLEQVCHHQSSPSRRIKLASHLTWSKRERSRGTRTNISLSSTLSEIVKLLQVSLFLKSNHTNADQETDEELLEDLDDIAVDNTVTLQLGTVMNTAHEYCFYFVKTYHSGTQNSDHQRMFQLRDKTKFANIFRQQQLQQPPRPPQQRPHVDQFSSPWCDHFSRRSKSSPILTNEDKEVILQYKRWLGALGRPVLFLQLTTSLQPPGPNQIPFF